MTNLVKTKKVCIGLLIVGALLAVLGLAVYYTTSVMGGVVLMIAGVSLAIISRSVLKLISLYSFNYLIQHAKNHPEDKKE